MSLDLLALIYPAYRALLPAAERPPDSPNHSINIIDRLRSKSRKTEADTRLTACLADIDKPAGYEDITFEPRVLIPPHHSEFEPPPVSRSIKSFASLTEEDARDALIRYASQNCCYSIDPIRDMNIKEIIMLSTFQYTLETFTEKREIVWCDDPYAGETIDSVKNGIAPGPWDVAQTPTEQFKDGTWQTEIPYTASTISCYACNGVGKEKCTKCEGSTKMGCSWCNKRGRRLNDELCTHCDGDGKKRCIECNSSGQKLCSACVGKGRLKFYVKLITTWTNHKDEFIHQQTSLPPELIRDVSGQVAFQEQQKRVRPVNRFPQNNVNEVSNDLVSKHQRAFPTERILQQRHEVKIVPVAQVKYTWNNTYGEFFVYGFENKVHFPDYPQTSCCGCVIV